MLCVLTVEVELSRRVLTRVLDQRTLVEAVLQNLCRPGHDRHMREPDLALRHGLDAARQPIHRPAYRNAGCGGAARHMTAEPNPVDRADKAQASTSVP